MNQWNIILEILTSRNALLNVWSKTRRKLPRYGTRGKCAKRNINFLLKPHLNILSKGHQSFTLCCNEAIELVTNVSLCTDICEMCWCSDVLMCFMCWYLRNDDYIHIMIGTLTTSSIAAFHLPDRNISFLFFNFPSLPSPFCVCFPSHS